MVVPGMSDRKFSSRIWRAVSAWLPIGKGHHGEQVSSQGN
jgi:hypothetical protein